jgi:hypothetical protein
LTDFNFTASLVATKKFLFAVLFGNSLRTLAMLQKNIERSMIFVSERSLKYFYSYSTFVLKNNNNNRIFINLSINHFFFGKILEFVLNFLGRPNSLLSTLSKAPSHLNFQNLVIDI